MIKKLSLLLFACLLQSCIIIRVYPEQPKAKEQGSSPDGYVFRPETPAQPLPDGGEGVFFIHDSEKSIDEPLQWKAKDSTGTNVFVVKQPEQPLIVVNGVVQDRTYQLQELQPKDIKEMNVLKGKSAEKKYGADGKNGVIEIILKD
ncbi:MAG: hypothetical protein ACON42_09395 [Flavobacteriaceae bacterium]